MNRKQINRSRALCVEMAEAAFNLKVLLPWSASDRGDLPCTTDSIREIRERLVEIEQLLGIPAKVKGDDVLWQLTKYSYPAEGVRVLLSIRYHRGAVEGSHEDGRWLYGDGTEIEHQDGVYAWSLKPNSLGEQRAVAGLYLLPSSERKAS